MPNYEVTAQHPFNTRPEAEKLAELLRDAAVSQNTGALVEVKKEGRAWVVKVWYPVKGEKKGKK